MVNVDVRPLTEARDSSENKCQGEIKNSSDPSSRSRPRSDNRSSVSHNMLREKLKANSRRELSKEKIQKAARQVGYDPKLYTQPFKGNSQDFKAIITAVKFKQLVLKKSPKRNLLTEAVLANTMNRAEEELLIRRRQRQLQRAQAVAEAKAMEENSRSDQNPGVEIVEDDAVRSLREFMDSISSVTR